MTSSASKASPEEDRLLAKVVTALQSVAGLRAIALGGSRARGEGHPDSDYDIGLYYDGSTGLDVAALTAAATLDDRGNAASVTPLGGWGPWIDGGGWLKVGGRAVDLLYRDLARVAAVIDDAEAGRVTMHYQPGHPHGFVSAIYMGEVALARPLWDPDGALAALQRRCVPYPPALGRALIAKFLWEARFALENAEKAVARADIAYLAGCGFRSIACLAQVLFALNGAYLLNEKGAVAGVERLALRPDRFRERAESAIAMLGSGQGGVALASLFELTSEVEILATAQVS